MRLIQEIIRSIRNLRAEKKVSPAKRLPATLVGGSKTELLKEQSSLIAALAGLDPDPALCSSNFWMRNLRTALP